ncbi:calcium-binding protein [Sphingomonas sp. ST-64]|uniref:Calcium-binding protein n=1 Tax=Sphingomonas plantiphila TaxID=3163295 RepID=A0ABW8YJV5_9SPHN
MLVAAEPLQLGTPGADAITGTPNDDRYITGPGADTVRGGGGNDSINGWTGDDILYGEAGDDNLVGFLGNDILYGGDGNDTLDASDELALDYDWAGFYARLAEQAGFPANWNVGPELPANHRTTSYLYGGAGSDILVGENTAGSFGPASGLRTTYMFGGTGDDIYYARFSDQNYIFENAGEGRDHIYLMYRESPGSGTVFYMPANIETLTGILGSAGHVTIVGNASDNYIITDGRISPSPTRGATVLAGAGNDGVEGTDFTDILFGEDGNDSLRGGLGIDTLIGGTGDDSLYGTSSEHEADALYGGAGNDYFEVDNIADLVFEDAGGGTDTVYAVISGNGYYLYANIENLSLGGGATFGVGNALNNSIRGDQNVATAETLLGGAGDDLINGYGGNDILYGEAGTDTLYAGDGIDFVAGGDGDDYIYGENGADSLHGEAGNDVIWGGSDFATDIMTGGDGNDTLRADSGLGDYDILNGGAGNDFYYVDTHADVIYEAAGGGTDTVYANISGGGYYLYANVERLFLQGTTILGVGNELDNVISGNSGTNWLYGMDGNDELSGGAGDDVLIGGNGNDTIRDGSGSDALYGEAGNDVFFLEGGETGSDLYYGGSGADSYIVTGGAGQRDYIADFEAGIDRIQFYSSVFASYAAIQAAMTQQGNDTVINLGNGDFIALLGVQMSTLRASDFGYSSAEAAAEPDHAMSAAFIPTYAEPTALTFGGF